MAKNIDKPKLLQIAEHFHRHHVEFLVIGGTAVVLLGCPITTFDVDLCYRRSPENLQNLANALHEVHPTLRGAPADLPFRIDAESLALGSNFTFNTDFGPLDLLGWVEPIGTYDNLVSRAERFNLGVCEVDVIGLDDLLTIKRHLQRPKDQAALQQLEELKRLRDQTS